MAGAIKFFQLFQKFHQIGGVRPVNYVTILFLISWIAFIFTTAAFFVLEARSILDYGFTFTVLVSYIQTSITYLIFIWQSEATSNFIEHCEKFIEKREHSAVAYKKRIEQIELLNKYWSYLIVGSVLFVYYSALPVTYVRYYIFDMGESSFFLFNPSWYPFDWRNPLGFLAAVQGAGGAATGFVYGQLLYLIFGSCWLLIFMAEDATQDVVAFNFDTKNSSDENRAEFLQRFCDMVQIYSDAKDCVMAFNEIIEYTLFAFFAWDMLFISGTLISLQFQLWADDTNLLKMGQLLLFLYLGLLYNFIVCEPGARMTTQFEVFGDEVGQCDWYLLPIEMKRMYIIFLSDTQNPVQLMSFGNITCERQTSKRVINAAWSYFMTFRNFRP